ncbi:MAG: hypothetical protein AABX23_03615 [Nanoarchaeota archaeon]
MIRGSLNVRAVQQKDSLQGFIRINHFYRGNHRVSGICGEFTASQRFQEIDYGNGLDKLFFYGDERDLTANYRNQDKARSIQRIFHVIYNHRNSDDGGQIEFGEIPATRLDLTREQTDLIRDILNYTSSFLRNSTKVKYVKMPEEGSSLRAIRSSLSRMFPPGVLKLVEDAGGYWDLTESIRLNTDKFPDFPKSLIKANNIS